MLNEITNILTVFPEKTDAFELEFQNCISQIIPIIQNPVNSALIIDVYLDSESFQEFQQREDFLKQQFSELLQKIKYILTIIPQKPFGHQLVLQIQSIQSLKTSKGSYSDLTVETLHGTWKIAVSKSFTGDIERDSIRCFSQIQAFLNDSNLVFGQVVRQWNYIGQIGSISQDQVNYQIFNNVRTTYYSNSSFEKGYPAATGIGMDYPGIIIKVWTFEPFQGNQIFAIDNPKQVPAYCYSKEVLTKNLKPTECICATPKFERGKAIKTNDGLVLLVSGTAAIHGEESVDFDTVEVQTEITINLILQLTGLSNLKRYEIDAFQGKPVCNSLIVYLKYMEDTSKVLPILQKNFPGIEAVITKADVCREELLVEIECILST